jgi:hypothetical protein
MEQAQQPQLPIVELDLTMGVRPTRLVGGVAMSSQKIGVG